MFQEYEPATNQSIILGWLVTALEQGGLTPSRFKFDKKSNTAKVSIKKTEI
jgi:hypothetical protein